MVTLDLRAPDAPFDGIVTVGAEVASSLPCEANDADNRLTAEVPVAAPQLVSKDVQATGGCGCRAPRSTPGRSSVVALGLLALAAARRRRRRAKT